MKKIILALFLATYSLSSYAQQDDKCSLSIRNGKETAYAHPFQENDIFRTLIEYNNAPIDNVGYFHNETQGKFCSGFLWDGYVITISTCINEIANNNVKDSFTVFYDNQKYTASVESQRAFDAIGVVKLGSKLPSKVSTLTSRTYEDHLNKPGWLIRGQGLKDETHSLYTQDNCWLTSGSKKTYKYQCSEKVKYKMGAVIMGNLCDQWMVAGFMDGVGNIFMIESSKLEHLFTHHFNKECKFEDAKPCSNITRVYPSITTDSPDLEMKYKFNNLEFNKSERYDGTFNDSRIRE
ncbi:MAG: hypothetical protein IT215_06925 [Chitinophagaceae bacterium]|nr:hypothetical protein [Chitinophagaceae bacterium]